MIASYIWRGRDDKRAFSERPSVKSRSLTSETRAISREIYWAAASAAGAAASAAGGGAGFSMPLTWAMVFLAFA